MKKLQTKRFIIVGPSGVGKSTLIKMILQIFINMRLAVSCTTRALRKSESDGVHYFKWSWFRFTLYRLFGKFAETDHHHGKWYGTLHSQASIGTTSTIFDVDVNGALNLQKLFPDAVTIFIHPPKNDPEELRNRLEQRAAKGDGDYSEIDKRVKRYEYEKTKADFFKYQLTNDNLFTCFAQFAFIIYKELGGTVIAIDGTAGCGKGTHAKNLASEFGGIHLDSGLLYRAVARYCQLVCGIMPGSESMQKVLDDAIRNYQEVQVDELLLRAPEVNAIVASWSCLQPVRDAVFMLQMKIAYGTNGTIVVAEGRDMTTHIFRWAQYRFFIDCPIEMRAERRAAQYGQTKEDTFMALTKRDQDDMGRALHPLYYDEADGVIKIMSDSPKEETFSKLKQRILI